MDRYRLINCHEGLTYDFGKWGGGNEFLFVDEQRKKYLSISTEKVKGERRLKSISMNPLQADTISNNPISPDSKQTIILEHYFPWAEQYINLARDEMRHEEGLTETQMQEMRTLEDNLLRILP